jgi:hypothetical protein
MAASGRAIFLKVIGMLLFVLWAALVVAALACAGYSHYRYRVIHNRYYARLFARDGETVAVVDIGRDARRSRLVPIVTLVLVCVLMPVSLLV